MEHAVVFNDDYPSEKIKWAYENHVSQKSQLSFSRAVLYIHIKQNKKIGKLILILGDSISLL